MTIEEAKSFLIDISYKLGNMDVEYLTEKDGEKMREAIETLEQQPKGHGRKFEEIVVEYPPAELCTYPEYRGKPYFSIKYEENGEHIIGFGTYKPEVLSSYIREYFLCEDVIKALDQQPTDDIYTKNMCTTQDRQCDSCWYSCDGHINDTETCHECMWDSKYVSMNQKGR